MRDEGLLLLAHYQRECKQLAQRRKAAFATGPVATIVTDNGGPFRSFTFEAFITAHPEL